MHVISLTHLPWFNHFFCGKTMVYFHKGCQQILELTISERFRFTTFTLLVDSSLLAPVIFTEDGTEPPDGEYEATHIMCAVLCNFIIAMSLSNTTCHGLCCFWNIVQQQYHSTCDHSVSRQSTTSKYLITFLHREMYLFYYQYYIVHSRQLSRLCTYKYIIQLWFSILTAHTRV